MVVLRMNAWLRQYHFWVGLIILLIFPLSKAATAPEAVSAKAQKYLRLSQGDVAAKVLKQSDRVVETNLRTELSRLDFAKNNQVFDWRLQGGTGYEKSQFESLTGLGNVQDEILGTQVRLEKTWWTGTVVGLEWNRNSFRSIYSALNPAAATMPAERTQDIFGLTLEQPLLDNFFGASDRYRSEASSERVKSARVVRASQLQEQVLSGLRLYWRAYSSKRTLEESRSAVERYEKLVGTVRRKAGFGYSNPGELPQVESELESRKQAVNASSADHLKNLDSLCEFLGIPSQDIEFEVALKLEVPPALRPVETSQLRAVRSMDSSLQSIELDRKALESKALPSLSLVGKSFASGLDEASETSFGEAVAGSKPKVYVGIKFEHSFGSQVQDEEALNQKIQWELKKIERDRKVRQIDIDLADKERQAKLTYLNVLSLEEQARLREKAMNEVVRAYSQGRTDIQNVIDITNRYIDTGVLVSKVFGDYQIVLAEWAALRDELIPSGEDQ